jgi:hypothetical protein
MTLSLSATVRIFGDFIDDCVLGIQYHLTLVALYKTYQTYQDLKHVLFALRHLQVKKSD